MYEKRKAVCSGNRYGIDNYQCMGNSRKCCHSLGDNDVMNTPSTLSSLPSVSPPSISQVLNSFPREELVCWLLLFQSTSYFLPTPKKQQCQQFHRSYLYFTLMYTIPYQITPPCFPLFNKSSVIIVPFTAYRVKAQI